MKKILITGATDGIGLETAKMLAGLGHHIILHGRNSDKLEAAKQTVAEHAPDTKIETYMADLSDLNEVRSLAENTKKNHDTLDILINNAGVLKTNETTTKYGIDIRFVVNTIAPYLLTQELLPILPSSARIINLSSAAQSPVNENALTGQHTNLDDMDAYAQSKLAITMWSHSMAYSIPQIIIAVNPGSLLASKMVKEGFGIPGSDLSKGAEILNRLSIEDEFSDKSGQYFNNDIGRFSDPHPDALNMDKCREIEDSIKTIINQ